MQPEFIVSLDLGTTKVAAAVGEFSGGGMNMEDIFSHFGDIFGGGAIVVFVDIKGSTAIASLDSVASAFNRSRSSSAESSNPLADSIKTGRPLVSGDCLIRSANCSPLSRGI